MEQQERRAALSAFFWTITVMAIAGGIFFGRPIYPDGARRAGQ